MPIFVEVESRVDEASLDKAGRTIGNKFDLVGKDASAGFSKNFASGLKSASDETVGKMGDLLRDRLQNAGRSAADQMARDFRNYTNDITQQLSSGVEGAFARIGDTITDVSNRFGLLSGVADRVGDAVSRWSLPPGFSEALDGVRSDLSGISNFMESVLPGSAATAAQGIEQAFAAMGPIKIPVMLVAAEAYGIYKILRSPIDQKNAYNAAQDSNEQFLSDVSGGAMTYGDRKPFSLKDYNAAELTPAELPTPKGVGNPGALFGEDAGPSLPMEPPTGGSGDFLFGGAGGGDLFGGAGDADVITPGPAPTAAVPAPAAPAAPADGGGGKQRIEESLQRGLELEASNDATKSGLVKQRGETLTKEQALQSAEAKLGQARLKGAESQTAALKSATDSMGQFGAQIDKDFGISKGLPGIAENLTKFVANLAFAPMYGSLMATMAADSHPVSGMAMSGQFGGVAAGGGFGGNVAAMMALAQSASGRTKYGPASDLVNGLADCSGSISDLVEMLQTGKTTPGRLFDTTNFATDAGAAALGFRPGYMPGALNVGVNPLPGQSGHMAATLPNGVNFEGGGGTGGGAQYGGAATGALDPQFPKQYYMPVGPMGGDGASTPLGIGVPPLYSAANTDPGLTDPLSAGLSGLGGGGGMGMPGMAGPPQAAPFGIAGGLGGGLGGGLAPSAPVGLAPSVGAGGEGFQGIGGLPMDALMTATMALGPAGIAAQKGIQLANRAVGYVGQLAGIGVSGLLNTFLPHESPLADIGNSWFGRIAGGIAGARPAGKNMAGASTLPNPEQAQAKAKGQGGPGADGGQGGITNNINVDASDRGDGQGIARDTAHAVNTTQQYAMAGPRGR